ncbi:MAG TPA: site-specific integrase [Candidatus Binataceae bacterium]|nr:site-specific integrase [Candidatus Binataceae bacterium]
MPSVYQNRSGNWECRIRRRGFPVQTATFDTKEEAKDWASTVEGDMVRGRFVDQREAERTTLAEALERYEREVLPRKRHERQEKSVVKTLLRHPISRMMLARVRSKDIAAYAARRQAAGIGPQQIRLDLGLLSHLFNIARREWGLEGLGNPVELVSKPRRPPGRNRRLEPGEEDRLVAAAKEYSSELPAFLVLALETGMRRAELAGLGWDRIDFERRTAHLPDTKTGEPRTVPLSPRALDTLKSLPRRLDGRLWSIGFLDSWTKAFRRTCKRAEIKDLNLHDLRHEATSRFFERGLSIEKVAAITGHKTWAMLRRYTHPRAEDIARELAAKA